jgi:hypothetical protein
MRYDEPRLVDLSSFHGTLCKISKVGNSVKVDMDFYKGIRIWRGPVHMGAGRAGACNNCMRLVAG